MNPKTATDPFDCLWWFAAVPVPVTDNDSSLQCAHFGGDFQIMDLLTLIPVLLGHHDSPKLKTRDLTFSGSMTL